MARSAHFFLSRIIKGGQLDVDGVLAALRKSSTLPSHGLAWTVLETSESTVTHLKKTYRYLSGKLVKYDPDAIVEVVDESARRTRLQAEPNMQRAGSLFVYLPDEAVLGHRHLWNEIRAQDFRIQLAALIKDYHKGFFIDCELEPIADLSRFLAKLSELDDVTEFKATVSPPNPLFGIFWENLKNYVQERRLRKMTIKEIAKAESTIPTTAVEIARRIEAGTTKDAEPAPIGDAAILMAADGYGRAEVTGRRSAATVVVKTAQNAVQLKLAADIQAPELAAAVVREVVRINKSRRLRHK